MAALSRQLGQLAARMDESERQRAVETSNAAAIRAAERAEEERRNCQEVEEWNSCLQSVQRALDERLSNTPVGGEIGKGQQQQNEPAGNVLQIGLSTEPALDGRSDEEQ